MTRIAKKRTTQLSSNFLRNVSGHTPTAKHSQNLVFDKRQRIHHLDICSTDKEAHIYDYIRDHVAKEFCDRVDDLKLDSKQVILNLGSCSGLVSKNINPDRVDMFIQADISGKSLTRCKKTDSMLSPKFPIHYVRCDEEFIPLRVNTVDIVMSCLNLHWVNDLVGCFKQVHSILTDDKPFIGVLFGGDTLYELRSSLQLAELERLSGFSSHVAPKTTGQDIARLLQLCGFQLITVDISEIKIHYPSAFELMFDLQGMGENNKSLLGSRHMHRDVLKATASVYQVLYGSECAENGVPATFQAIHFIGWKNPTKTVPVK
jgi:NADH dehydrogenase [ubiquinone] 1 alpha subcomplex assembly factor 5